MKKERNEKKIEERALKSINGYYDKLKSYVAEGIMWSAIFTIAIIFVFGTI